MNDVTHKRRHTSMRSRRHDVTHSSRFFDHPNWLFSLLGIAYVTIPNASLPIRRSVTSFIDCPFVSEIVCFFNVFERSDLWHFLASFRPSFKSSCDMRFQRAFTACCCVFQVITLTGSNQCNYFENATACNKRSSDTRVATSLRYKTAS